MSKIRVVHLITKLELGGAQKNTIFTFENLNRNIFEPFLLSGDGGILTPDITDEKGSSTRSGGRFIIVKDLIREINPFRDLKAFKFLKSEFRRLKPDIVHTHSSKAGILGRLAAQSAGVPVVIHSVHGFPFSPFQPFFKRNIFKIIEKIGSRFTSHYIFVSENDALTAERSGLLRKASYSLIRSGFDFGRFEKRIGSTLEIKKKYGIKKTDFVCGVISPFKPQKGLFNLVKIASKALQIDRDLLFFIAGDGHQREAIEMELEICGIRERFIMPGFIHDIENIIPIFDVGISTALWEGLPQSLVQFRLMNKAVIASDIPGNREIIRDGLNGYIKDINDIDGFVQKILFLREHQDVRRSLSNCPENLEDWRGDLMVRAQQELYVSLLEGRER